MEQHEAEALYDQHAAEEAAKPEEKTEDAPVVTEADNDAPVENAAESNTEGDPKDDAEDGADDGTVSAGDSDDEPEADDTDTPEPVELQPRDQFIYENLPVITVRGSDGKGKVRDFTVRVAQELPEDFKFANERERAVFSQALAEQSGLASRLDDKWKADQTAQQTQAQQMEEAKSIRAGVEELQKQGLLPKFDRTKADTDPKAAPVREALDYYNKLRADGEKVSFKLAFKLLQADKASGAAKTKTDTNAQVRKEVSAQVGGARGEVKEVTESRWRPGMRIDDVTTAYAEDFED